MRKAVLRYLAAAVFVVAGVLHFVHADFFRSIVPPGFPSPDALVAISGVFEIAGGISLLIPPLRKAAGWGLIALLIAVFPANIYMVAASERFDIPTWILWLRLPMQVIIIYWVWLVAQPTSHFPAVRT